ncbi:hypothetical protein EYR41_001629 [Orbilia oligospora]|uniref:Uncharacterized protein n=1 Tax=Orbilia oligospora TaxID=2813651 RepID=A0A7C8JXZ6_ORBOL|nr:hypothetical protein TWF751_005224 [Orbilia oligospora]KAF3247184.1 hypothetical protein TWF128_008681 [Orbilia oligospora]TGJ74654.1 hypothetical protein EYR41_001629 [Orbilia oligospora]
MSKELCRCFRATAASHANPVDSGLAADGHHILSKWGGWKRSFTVDPQGLRECVDIASTKSVQKLEDL